jgi:radical SAM superfamily enzyme YgiQ (UPF0313 family)
MRVAVILVWRPKHFPDWHGRHRGVGPSVPTLLAYDSSAAPYSGTHIASLLPRDWDVTLIHEMVRDVDVDMPVDAVFLSTMDFCAPHARWLAKAFRARGVRVIVGGLYPTLNPAYFASAADAVVVGEAEPVMPKLISDLRRNRLEAIYHAHAPADLSGIPPPRYDLVEPGFTVPMGYEATRGCPFTCSFCVLSAIRSPFRRRPIPHVLRDIKAVPSSWSWRQRKIVNFWDNNLGSDRAYFRDLCEALIPMKRFWATQTSIDTITRESARFMGRSGCRYLYIGLESLSEDSLIRSNKRQNRVKDYRQRIRYLHDNGIIVMSIFLVGLDGDTPEYLRELPDLVDHIDVDVPVYSLPVPIEGTPFRRELAEGGRLLPGDLLDGSDGVHLVYRPRRVAPDELETALATCMQRSYNPLRVAHRVGRRVRHGHWPLLMSASANRVYMRYERALARTGLRRVAERGPWPSEVVGGSPVQAAAPSISVSSL